MIQVRPNIGRPLVTAPQQKRRLIDKLVDACKITAVCVLLIVAFMIFVRALPFSIGVNITAIGLFFLTSAITFVKSSRYAEDAVVIGGSVVSFIGLFAFCPPSLLWEWSTLASLLVLIVFIEVFRALRKALQVADKVSDSVIDAVTQIAHRQGEQSAIAPDVPMRRRTARIPRGRAQWALSGLLAVLVFLLARMVRIIALATLSPVNIIFTTTALIGLGVLGMMAAAFSRSNNAGEDALAGASVSVAWIGIYLAWPHPVWHILLLLAAMALMAGGTLAPLIVRFINKDLTPVRNSSTLDPYEGS